MIEGMDLAIFYDILSAVGLGYFTLKIAELVATNHFVAPHPYISVCGIDKKAILNSAASCALWQE